MAKPLEALALHLQRAAAAALAASSTSARRRVEASHVFQVLASDAVLAALRASTSAAASRAAIHAVSGASTTSSSNLTPPSSYSSYKSASATLEARLPSSAAGARGRGTADRATSASGSSIMAMHALDWVRAAALGTDSTAPATPGDFDCLASLLLRPACPSESMEFKSRMVVPTAAAARHAANLAALGILTPSPSPLRTGLPIVPSAHEAALAAVLPGAARSSATSYQCPTMLKFQTAQMAVCRPMGESYSAIWRRNDGIIAFPFNHSANVDDLIHLINHTTLNPEDELLFRKFLNDKFHSSKVHDVAFYLESSDYTFDEWCHLLKIVHQRIGPHKELMEFLIKEGRSTSSDEEFYQDPFLARMDTKLDAVLKRLDEQGPSVSEILKQSKRVGLAKLLSLLLNLFG